jgi:trans-aconitate methyltransferase
MRCRLLRVSRKSGGAAMSRQQASPGGGSWPGTLYLWDIFQRLHRFRAADRVVEFGPGYGRLIKTAIERKIPCESFIGVDLSQTCVVQLTTEFETDRRFTFVEGDVNTWTASGQIDVVLCSSTFEHLYPDCRRALLNLRAQLASGTSVFIDFVKYDHARRWFEPDGRT